MDDLFERADSVLRLHRHFREDGLQMYFLIDSKKKYVACVCEEDIIKYKPELLKGKGPKQTGEEWE